jgi:hypothetical protein
MLEASTFKERTMFDLYCDACHKQQLLGAERVRHLINDDQGIAVILQCYCGELAAVRTGVSADERRREHASV